MFEFSDVRYKDILSINHLMIEDDCITCIVGESGSGKTTLLKLFNLMISPTHGQIHYNSNLLETLDSIDHRRHVIMLGQEAVMYPGSIRDNLQIGLVFSEKEPASDKKLNEILNAINLKKQLDTPVFQLSGGEKQRIAIGRVMLLNPDVLLLDEPSSALDHSNEKSIIELIAKYVKNQNKSLIMVTHSPEIAELYGEVIIEMSYGKIDQIRSSL